MEFHAVNPVLQSRGSIQAYFGSDVDREGKVHVNLLRHLYMAQLLVWPTHIIRRFWEGIPLERNGVRLGEMQRFQLVWGEQQRLPLNYLLRVLGALEGFCRDEELDCDEFCHSFFQGVYPYRHLSSQAWLLLLRPLMAGLFAAPDRRSFLLRHFPSLHTEFYQHATHELVSDEEIDGVRRAVLVYSLDNSSGVALDYGAWILPWLKGLPQVFGMPVFEEVRVIADVRRPEQVLPAEELESREQGLHFQGRWLGRRLDFSEWCRERGLPLRDPFLATDECWVVDDEPPAEEHGSSLVRGCCYGAPVYIVEVKYAPLSSGPRNPLEGLVESMVRSDPDMREKLDGLHEKFVEGLTHRSEIVYYKEDDSISVNGEHFIRNVPAKIFRKVVRAYMMEGRTEFENREFKRDPEITLDISNPNFEGRLNRLMAKLAEDQPELQIVRRRRGGFQFTPKCAIEYREE